MSRRVFFYDDQDLAARHNLNLVYGPVRKLGVADMEYRDCDQGRPNIFCGSVVPLPADGYRLYYSSIALEGPKNFQLALAESADGVTWTKPDLGQIQYHDGDTNWILPEGLTAEHNLTQPQVMLLPDGSWRMWFWWHGHEFGRCMYVAAESDDGIKWRCIDLQMPHIMHPSDRELGQNALVAGLTEASAEDEFGHLRTMDFMQAKRLRSNDANFVYYNQEDELFEMYQVWLIPVDEDSGRMTPHDNASSVLRTIARRDSADGIIWSDPEMLILADEHDPMHQQFYYLAVHREGPWNIGLLGNYRCWEQTMDLELCFSRDAHHWIRPLRGGWIPRGGVDEIDYMSVYPTSRFIDRGDTWLVLYNSGNLKHNRKLPEGVAERCQEIMAAEAPKGRFAGLKPSHRTVGSLILRRFNQSAECITVNGDIKGRLQAELRDPYGRPLPGYELNSCIPITGDSACHVLTWEGGRTTAEYRYDVVGLRIEVEDGTIYSVET